MSWLFSQALVAEYSAAICSDGEPSALSKSTYTPQAYLSPDRTMEFSRRSLFGMTFAPLTESRGADLLTWFREGFRARTSASQEKEQESREVDQDCGRKCRESLAKWNHSTHSWKIAQRSLFEDLEPSLVIWPRWGSMQNGECFHVETPVVFTYENASGLSLPTTSANEWRGSQKRRYIGSEEYRGAKMSEGLRTCETDPIYLNPLFAELVMMWPLGWTDLKPLEMDKFREWQQQHGNFLAIEQGPK